MFGLSARFWKENVMKIASGKGGTGKTTVAVNLALSLRDGDVEEPNCNHFLGLDLEKVEDVLCPYPVIDPDKCTLCGECADFCRYNALAALPRKVLVFPSLCHDGCGGCREVCRYGAISENFMINTYSCEGCAVCTVACPESAITLETRFSGQVVSSKTRFGPMVAGSLGVGEDASGKLVTLVRKQAQELAEANSRDLVIIDGPPGAGCPVIAAIAGADLILLVCEPTVSGIHDLKRVIELTSHFPVPAAVCINKCDINEENSLGIEEFCT